MFGKLCIESPRSPTDAFLYNCKDDSENNHHCIDFIRITAHYNITDRQLIWIETKRNASCVTLPTPTEKCTTYINIDRLSPRHILITDRCRMKFGFIRNIMQKCIVMTCRKCFKGFYFYIVVFYPLYKFLNFCFIYSVNPFIT